MIATMHDGEPVIVNYTLSDELRKMNLKPGDKFPYSSGHPYVISIDNSYARICFDRSIANCSECNRKLECPVSLFKKER